MTVTVEVEKKEGKIFSVRITTECEMAQELGKAIPELTMMDAFKRLQDNPVYKKGATCLKHAACPVPAGILKALEVEAGLNLPKDAAITFVKTEKDSRK
jgi:hypothetical protein